MNILRNIPTSERTKVVRSVLNIDKNLHKTHLIEKDIVYLFDLWNEYVQPSNPQDINCKGCRTSVFGRYKFYVKEWKEWSKQEASL